MVGLLLSLVLTAQSSPRLALPDISVVHLDEARRSFFGEHLAQQLKLLGANVITAREIATMLGMERQRQLLGCEEGVSCMTELADALGAQALVMVSLARFDDDTVQLNLKIISSGQARTLAAWSDRVPNPAAVTEALSRAAPVLLAQTYRALGHPLPPALVLALKSPLEKYFWVPGTIGLAALGTGLGLYLSAQQDFAALTTPQATLLTTSQAAARRDGGKLKEPLGVGLLLGGGVAVVTAGVMLLVGRSNPVQVPTLAFVPTAQGGVLVGGWSF